MKVVFTLTLGVLLGWVSSVCDREGQVALEQHQIDLEARWQYQAASEYPKEEPVKSVLFAWP
ncbi:hypothetical protein [Rufibacter psychrotolerans]|uniref:hypothetical protein n=1 Tax=Rufibacter psychrotolerans TaxID=2812556 RepID=UPI001967522E|nr:hypothetical protein [Rufibacter sp. SYSU D00308]